MACAYMNINWLPAANNSLICDDTWACYQTPYPPSNDQYTPYSITCQETYQCYHAFITCPGHATCDINCYGRESCSWSQIYCPSTAKCNIQCIGPGACAYATVHWSSDHTIADLTCPDGGWQCNLLQNPFTINSRTITIWDDETRTFECSDPKKCAPSYISCPNNGDCTISCTSEACAGAIINCPINGDCRISCDGDFSCWNAIFNGPINNQFLTYCAGDYACYKASFHAENSSYFNFSMASSPTYATTARAISIWFPPRDGTSKRASIAVEYGFNGNAGWEPLLFYARNGWLDASLVYNHGSYTYHGGIMHCHTDYADSCWFADLAYSCEASNTICEPQWVQGSPSMPANLMSSSVGYYQNTIAIIGGYFSGQFMQQLTEYDLDTDSFTYYSTFFANVPANTLYGNSQWWTQLGDTLYMAEKYNGYTNSFNLESKQFTSQFFSTAPLINDGFYPCLAASNDEQSLYYLGGYAGSNYLDTLQILNISSASWSMGPSMNEKRAQFSCITSSNDKLYAIGSHTDESDTMEYIQTTNIHDNVWIYLDDKLIIPARGTRTVKYYEYLFIIPGHYHNGSQYIYTDKVHIIDTITDKVSMLPVAMITPISQTIPIIVNDTIYVFGGWNGPSLNIWQTYTIDLDTLNLSRRTNAPTVDPTQQPSANPIIEPTKNPNTFAPTSLIETETTESRSHNAAQNDFLSMQNPVFIAILIGAICMCLCVVIVLLMRHLRRIQKKISRIQSESARAPRQLSVNIDNIRNGLVAIISIGKYDKHPGTESADLIGSNFKDLPVEKDVNNLKKLFQILKYTVIPHEIKLHWTQNEVLEFLKETGRSLFSDDECHHLMYDGLIVCITSHGIEDHIVTSDYKAIKKKAIHRLLSMTYPKIRDIPRIFLYDACDGNADMNHMIKQMSTMMMDKGKYFGMEELEMTAPTALNETWTVKTNNPDYKLVEIHAANTGFQAKLSPHVGSYMLYEFTKRMKRAIINGEDVTLGRLFDKIQNDLHEHGKQQIVKVFNNDTSHIRLKICNDEKRIVMTENEDMLEAKENEIDDETEGFEIDDEMRIELHELSRPKSTFL